MHSGEGSGKTLEPFPVPKGVPGELEMEFGQGTEKWMRGNGFKVTEGAFGWDIGKEFFPEVRPWHRLLREAVAASSLEEVQARMDGGSEQAGLVEGVPAHGGGLDGGIFKVPFQPKPLQNLCYIQP